MGGFKPPPPYAALLRDEGGASSGGLETDTLPDSLSSPDDLRPEEKHRAAGSRKPENVNNAGKGKISVDANGAKMAFDQFHNTGSDSYYSPYKFQNDFSGDSGQLSQHFTTDFSLHDEPQLPYNSWAAQDDPDQLINYAQGISKNRNPIDGNGCGSETDLYGLVSTILEEVDPMDSYFSQETLSGLKTVWSPKSMKEDNLQYFNSEAKMQSSSGMQSDHFCPEPVGRDSNQSADIYQHFNGVNVPAFDAADPAWLFSTCNGEPDTYTPGVQDLTRPPPGLSIPPATNAYLSKGRVGKSEYGTPMPGKDNSFCSISDALSENMDSLNDLCRLSNMMNDSCFSPYQDFIALSRPKVQKNRSFSTQDANMLTSNIQALLMGEEGDVYKSELAQNNFVKAQDENMVRLKSLPLQKMSAFVSHMPSLKREMTGSLREQRACDGVKSQPLQSDYTPKEFSGFSQPSDYFEHCKNFSPPFNPSAPPQSKETTQRETRTHQTSLHQFHHGQSNHYQSKAKLPAKTSINTEHPGISKLLSHSLAEFVPLLSSQQRPTARVLTDFGQGDGLSLQGRMGQAGLGLGLEGLRNVAGSGDGVDFNLQLDKGKLQGSAATSEGQRIGAKPKSPASFPREADKQQGLLQNPFLGNMYAGHARHKGAGFSQAKSLPCQMFPYMYQMGDPRQNQCHLFPSRSLLPYGPSMPYVDMSELLPDGEFATLNPYLQELIGPNPAGVDGSFPGFLHTMRSPKLTKSRGAPMSQLHHYLEECYEQWRMLEKERKKTEAVLVKSYPDKHLSMESNSSLPKMPPNPSRVDRLIVDQLREQAKVVSLLGKMERLWSFPLHANICSALDRHLEAIYITQARRKDEFLNSSSRQRQGSAYLREDREIFLLASALKDLSSSTRKSRTALWCALQMTLPKTSTGPDDGGEGDTCSPLGQHSPDQIIPERAV
ncbi:meiosis-specific coiled-coil domain-containing protein MEIOC [Colossoma macropomum]|uniref:meiosis-specific coiled-coil domain-containing protein MEIOC n=1 Tax=Colossoma macropomum TaxID=42526 RepID=UPI0018643F80|nr:meiosis-specific coiled-coil domain-containing protein MEIOC [Colossoma macropomum]